MARENTKRGKDLLNKVVVSEEAGKKYGKIGDVSFISQSGELMNIVLVEPTRHAAELEIEKDEEGRDLIPFSAVQSVGDFVIVSEKDIV
ncbi:MAG: PRC-barrel domain-containing protein [Candidatus Aenigmatarchaeota archaeon]